MYNIPAGGSSRLIASWMRGLHGCVVCVYVCVCVRVCVYVRACVRMCVVCVVCVRACV